MLRMAASQGGVVTTAQARALGWDKRSLREAVRSGVLHDLGRSLYAVPTPDLQTKEGRHRALCRGGLLLYPDAVLGRTSAVLAHGLPVYGVDLSRVWLQRAVTSEVNPQSFVIRPKTDATVCSTDLGSAMTPAVAIIQMTLDHGIIAGVVAADRALHTELITFDELHQVAGTVSGWPHSARVTTMLSMVDGRSESVGESRLRIDLSMSGIPVIPQKVVLDQEKRFVARVDFGVGGTNVLIEFDGLVSSAMVGPTHSSPRRRERIRCADSDMSSSGLHGPIWSVHNWCSFASGRRWPTLWVRVVRQRDAALMESSHR